MPTIKSLFRGVDILAATVNMETKVMGLEYDSRRIKAGDLFVAIDGFQTDGHLYIPQAIKKQALAVVIDNLAYCSSNYPWILVKNSRQTLALLSAAFYQNPTEKLLLIAVTGTNGKTTTSNLIANIFENSGYKIGLIGTIHNRIGNKFLPVEHTTPESLDLQALFDQMLKEHVNCAVLEVSSHALDLERVRACNFGLAVFTNLTQDHLDYHCHMEDYYLAKSKLFLSYLKKPEKCAIINIDDEWGQRLYQETNVAKLSYGIKENADLVAKKIKIAASGVDFTVEDYPVHLHLTGEFNVYNALAALGAAHVMGISLEKAIGILESVQGIPGRMQTLPGGQDFTVIIDYAHTPDGLVNLLRTVRGFAKRRIITVFGCGGDRDRSKRPLMREAAGKYSDLSIITSDNPRSEKPENIIDDILRGIDKKKAKSKYIIIIDRKEAIKKAIGLARKDDIIIIAGKGHETYQEINGFKYPFDDQQVALGFLQELGY